MVNALILAGDRGEDGVSKALLRIGQKYMIEYIIDALNGCANVKDIYIVCDENVENKISSKVKGCIRPREGIIENIQAASEYIKDKNTPLIICTADIPLVSSEAVDDFVIECESKNIDVGYPIIDKRLNDVKYPDVKRTYVKMKEGTYTGGNIIYIKMEVIDKFTDKAKQLVQYRKKPLKMSRILGITFLLRLALGKLTIPAVESKIGRMFDVNGKAILTKYPEIGNDVDKQEDIDFVKKYLNIV
ncbi:nucleotidyltransferase family protein [Thermobrachium celere]|uniref:nucleotidyltransferase family protein n=1 Tax=Thermobrachium celere TaxID=53422 RepID=UPI0019407147|nr:nucleotidyltransferase family protein [Thermobrachium celere]GFR35380.1 hypothetical protein TCEA9_11920 [Thermobrachium celere]